MEKKFSATELTLRALSYLKSPGVTAGLKNLEIKGDLQFPLWTEVSVFLVFCFHHCLYRSEIIDFS